MSGNYRTLAGKEIKCQTKLNISSLSVRLKLPDNPAPPTQSEFEN